MDADSGELAVGPSPVAQHGRVGNAYRMTEATLADLRPDPANARKHNPRNIGMIVSALHQVGAARSIVIDEHGMILAGNGVVEAAAEAGIERVQIVDADGETIVAVRRTGLTDEQKIKLALYDNRTAELADWDVEVLGALDVDLGGMFFESELAELGLDLGEEPAEDPGAQIDKAAELQEKWQTERGQIWQIGKHRLLCGDSTSAEDVARLMGGEKVGMIATDPPFAITGSATGSADMSGVNIIAPFFRLWMREWFGLLPQFGHVYVCCDWRTYSLIDTEGKAAGLSPKNCIVWYKGQGGLGTFYQNSHEFIWFAVRQPPHRIAANPVGQRVVRGMSNVWEMSAVTYGTGDDKAIHTASKPPELFVRAIENSCDEGDIIGEPFAGAGVCYVAAEQTGRVCFGCEIEPKYCAVTLERMVGMGLEPVLTSQ